MKNMKKLTYFTMAIVAGFAIGCSNDDETPLDPGQSSSELLVAKFAAAPTVVEL